MQYAIRLGYSTCSTYWLKERETVKLDVLQDSNTVVRFWESN